MYSEEMSFLLKVLIINILICWSFLFSMELGEDDPLKNFPKTWNLPDVVIYTGQAFIYKLPPGEKYSISESGLNFLPEWLEFDSDGSRLLGIPRREDAGRSYLFRVESLGDPSRSDLFRAEVRDFDSAMMSDINDPDHPSTVVRCDRSKPRTSASVVLDVSPENPDFTVVRRLELLQIFSERYEVPQEGLTLGSSTEVGDGGTPFDDSALVAGPGDAAPPGLSGSVADPEDAHVIVRWTVGCGSVVKRHMDILQRVEREAADGTLGRALGQSIVGWYVTNRKPKRKRRVPRGGAYPTPTPTLSAVPPTAMVSYPPPKVIPDGREEGTNVEAMATPVTMATSTVATTTEGALVSRETKSRQKTQKTKKPSMRMPEFVPTPSPFVRFVGIKSFHLFQVRPGEVFMLEVTPDFFSATPVRLELLTSGGVELNDDSWIKLSRSDPSPRSTLGRPLIYGIPLLMHEGLQDYILRARDAIGGTADVALKFKVSGGSVEPLFFEANMIFNDLDYDRFVTDVDLRMNLTRAIASVYGPGPPLDIVMTRLDRGSVDYWWTNSTLSHHGNCPRTLVMSIYDRVVDSSSRRVDPRFLDAVAGFGISYVEFHARGDCEREGMSFVRPNYLKGSRITPRMRIVLNSTSVPMVIYKHSGEEVEEEEEEEERGRGMQEANGGETIGGTAVESSSAEAELLKQIVIPVLVVVALVLLSAIIACLVCRRRDVKQPKSSDSTELVSKGAPVIFAHELGEAPPPPSLSPRALLPSGGGRSPKPPNYHRRIPHGGPGPGYGDFYASEGLMTGRSRYVSS